MNKPPGLTELCTQLYHQGRLEEAEQKLTRHIQREKNDGYALLLLAQIAFDRSRLAQCEFFVKRAIAVRPDIPHPYNLLAQCLWALNRSEEALPIMRKATQLAPNDAPLWSSTGHIAASTRRYSEAIACYHRSLEINRVTNEAAFQGLGQTYGQLGRWNKSLDVLAEGCRAMPDNPRIASDYAVALNYTSGCTPQQQLEAHLEIGRRLSLHPSAPAFPVPAAVDRTKKLRVGLLSGDFLQHPVAFFMEPILAERDTSAVEYVLIGTRGDRDQDAWFKRLRSCAAAFASIVGNDESGAAAIVRKLGCDVLIDLAGHTMATAVWLLRNRLAPVQITYLGYPNTTGIPNVDYRIVATLTDPPGYEAYCSERLLRLDPCMHCFRPAPESPDPATTREPGPIRFGSFNHIGKMSDVTIDLWSRVLAEVPGSTLMLKSNTIRDDESWELIRDEFKARGVDPSRLLGVPRTGSLTEHLALYDRVDVALDPTPYNGTTTTCEALWMGVPVVAVWGDRHAARVSGSLLHAAGLPELVVDTPDAYVALARSLAQDEPRRAEYRRTLRARVAASTLCDAKSMARRFEAAIRTAWNEACDADARRPERQML